MDRRYRILVNQTVDSLNIDNKSCQEIIDAFECVVTSVFEDGVRNWGQSAVIEYFAAVITERARSVDKNHLTLSFDRLVALERRK